MTWPTFVLQLLQKLTQYILFGAPGRGGVLRETSEQQVHKSGSSHDNSGHPHGSEECTVKYTLHCILDQNSTMIKAILVFNNHGKPRLMKFYQYYVSTLKQRNLQIKYFLAVSLHVIWMKSHDVTILYCRLDRRKSHTLAYNRQSYLLRNYSWKFIKQSRFLLWQLYLIFFGEFNTKCWRENWDTFVYYFILNIQS